MKRIRTFEKFNDDDFFSDENRKKWEEELEYTQEEVNDAIQLLIDEMKSGKLDYKTSNKKVKELSNKYILLYNSSPLRQELINVLSKISSKEIKDRVKNRFK
jgi:hypothetical protein